MTSSIAPSIPRRSFIQSQTSGILLAAIILGAVIPGAAKSPAQEPIRVLVVDGQNNHNWKVTTPLIVQTLKGSGKFTVDVATAPAADQDMAGFKPEFAKYQVVVSNYNGKPWPEGTQQAFDAYIANGGGFVSVHAADNSFPEWSAYNRMIGVGGWGGRTEKNGPYIRWRDGNIVRDTYAGRGGSHGRRHPFTIVVRDDLHPITAGLPTAFTQAEDELYAELRGPAQNMHVLATALSNKETGGTGEHEPILMTINYGEGRVFHTTLGHDAVAMSGLAFQVTLQRGTEWAATGNVTFAPPAEGALTSNDPALRDPMAYGIGAKVVSAEQTPDPDSDGWLPIFNGQSLEGWTQKNGTASYKVEEGVIVGRTAVGSPSSFLCTTAEYQNFELSFEVKVDDALNSGVQVRSQSKPEINDGKIFGPQVEIEALDAEGKGDSGYIYSEGTSRGWLTAERPIQDTFINGQWNRFHVRAVGNRIQTWVNGKKVADLTDDESSKVGFIGLQVHGNTANDKTYEVRWRDIKVRPLADDAELK